MKWASCFLYEKDNVCETRVPFHGNVTAEDLDFYAFSKRFYYNKADSRVKITDLNIDLEEFLKTANKETKKEDTKKESSKKSSSLIILGKMDSFPKKGYFPICFYPEIFKIRYNCFNIFPNDIFFF